MEPGINGARAGRFGARVRGRTVRAGHHRGRKLPRRDQDRGRVVSKKGARPRHRDLQLRFAGRGGGSTSGHSVDRTRLWLAGRLHHPGSHGIRLGGALVDALHAPGTKARDRSCGACAHHRGRTRWRAERKNPMGPPPALPRGLGVRGRKIFQRPDLVVFSFLAAEVSEQGTRAGSCRHGAAARCHLQRERYRQHWWRMDHRAADELRMEPQRS